MTYIIRLIILFILFSISRTETIAQIERKGILRSVISKPFEEPIILEIDYNDSLYAKFKAFSISGETIREGFLNRFLFNLLDESSSTKTIVKDFASYGVLTDGYTYYNPNLLFIDTAGLLDYDYRKLLKDSICIEYYKGGEIADTLHYKIFKNVYNERFYNFIIGKFNHYDKNGNLEYTGNIDEIRKDLFLKHVKYYKGGCLWVETKELITADYSILSYLSLELKKEKAIKKIHIGLIGDEILLYRKRFGNNFNYIIKENTRISRGNSSKTLKEEIKKY